MSSAGVVYSSLSWRSDLNLSMSRSLKYLHLVNFLSFPFWRRDGLKHNIRWSEIMSPACTFWTSFELVRVITRSKVWPPTWVGPLMRSSNPKLVKICVNFCASEQSSLSKWILKSPAMMDSLFYESISSSSETKLFSKKRNGSGRWSVHNHIVNCFVWNAQYTPHKFHVGVLAFRLLKTLYDAVFI